MKLFTFLITALVAFAIYIIVTTPNASTIEHCIQTSIYKVWLCDKSPNYVPLYEMSPIFRSVVVASEDGNFYHHHGFDWNQIHQSFDEDLEARHIVRGGSTITQQLAKNVFLSSNRTVMRKLREAYLTVQIEALLTKNKILEKYLNIIKLGPEVYGVKEAAKYYFNATPNELNLLQSAYLAYLIPDPRNYSATFRHKKLTAYAKYRILELSYEMYRMNKISAAEYELAQNDIDEFPWSGLPAPSGSASASATALNNKPAINARGGQVGEHNPEKNQVNHVN